MSVNIKFKNNSIAELSDTGTKTLKTAGKYCEADIIVENTKDGITPSGNKAITATTSTQTGIDVTNYATVSVAPTPSETKSVTTNGDVTPSSGKLLSKVTVNVPTGTARDSSDLTVSGATVNVPAGLYSSAASKSVASGTAGTPTASKSAVSNNSVTVTPSVTNTEGYITGGTKTGTGVKVSASELVSGNKALTPSSEAQTGIDVANYSTVSVGAITKELLASLDADFVAENIKKDVDLFGLIGALESGGGGSGVNIATAAFTVAEDTSTPFVITHNLGSIPKIAICIREILSTSGFGKESFVDGELLFSYAVNGEKKGRAYKMSGTSNSAEASLAVAMYGSYINFADSTSSNLNGSPIGSCTKTTAMLRPAYNSNIIFAAGKPYRWILISTGDAI